MMQRSSGKTYLVLHDASLLLVTSKYTLGGNTLREGKSDKLNRMNKLHEEQSYCS